MTDLVTSRDLEIKPSNNYVKNSHTFTMWSLYTGCTTGQADPFGGNNAILCVGDPTIQYSSFTQSTNWVTPGNYYTLSFYAKPYGRSDGVFLALSGGGNGGDDLVRVNWNTRVVDASGFATTLNTGLIDVGGGWFRVWATVLCLKYRNSIGIWSKYGYDGTARSSSQGNYIYGIQVEDGTKLSKYMPTGSTAVYSSNILSSSQDTNIATISDILPLTSSNLFSNSSVSTSWSSQAVNFTHNQPDPLSGTLSALIVPNTTNSFHRVSWSPPSSYSVGQHTASIYAKSAGYSTLILAIERSNSPWDGSWIRFNTTTGTFTSSSLGRSVRVLDYGSINIGNGWYRFYVKFDASFRLNIDAISIWFGITDISVSNNTSFAGDGTSGMYMFGPQFEQGFTLSDYTPTIGAAYKYGFSTSMQRKGSEVIDTIPLPSPIASLDFTIPVLDPRITFGRSDAVACATRVNSRGLIETVAANIPRFDYDPVTLKCLGLLVETGSSNMYTYSQDFSNTNIWRAYGQGVSLGSFLAPDGSITAYKVMESNGTSGDFGFARFGAYGNLTGTYTGSCYVKRINNRYAYFWHDNGGGDGLTLELDFNTGSTRFTRNGSANYTNVSGGAVNAGNGWWRVYITSTIANSTGGQLRVYTSSIPWTSGNFGTPTYTGNNVDGLYVWGFQLEQNPIMSSYIPTTSTSLTRTPDYVDLYVSTNMAGTVYVETGGSQYGLIIGPIPVVVGYPGSYEFATVRTSSRVGSWNGVNEVNTTNNSVVANNGFRYAIAWNKNGSYTSLNGISDQTGEGNSIGFGSTTYLRMGVYTTRPHSTRYKKLHLYSSKLPLATINTITSNSQPIVGTTTVNKLSAEITDLIPGTHNLLFNSEFLGANSNVLPTNWDFNGHGFTRTGITMTIKPGTYQGYSGLFLRYFGTATSANEHVLVNRYPGGAYIPGIPFITTNFSIYIALINGTKHNSFMIQNISRSKTSSALSSSVNYMNLTSALTRYSISHNNPTSNTEYYATKVGLAGFAINDIIDFTIFISSPQYNYGSAPLTYIPTGVNEISYGKISSTLSETSEITDLLKQSTSSFDIYANLVKFYTSGRQLSKEYSYPTLSTGSREIIFNTDRQGTNEYSSEARTTFSTDPRAVTLDAYIRPTNLYTSDHATETFSMPHKSPTFTKDP